MPRVNMIDDEHNNDSEIRLQDSGICRRRKDKQDSASSSQRREQLLLSLAILRSLVTSSELDISMTCSLTTAFSKMRRSTGDACATEADNKMPDALE